MVSYGLKRSNKGVKVMNILIAMDSFKGSVTSRQAGEAVQKGLDKFPNITSQVISVSDGGEGSLQVLYDMGKGDWKYCNIQDAFHIMRRCPYLLCNQNGVQTAYIESAQIIGLHDHHVNQTTVENVSSFGLGELLYHVMHQDVDEIVIFLGGTITTDGGLGMLQALGVDIYDEQGKCISTNTNPLLQYTFMDQKKLQHVKEVLSSKRLIIGSDVLNVFSGKQGAAHVFAAQKGANHNQIISLDQKLELVAKQQKEVKLNDKKGSGAAGGIGGMLLILGGHIENGFDILNKSIHFEEYVKQADLIFTGEGSIDCQSNQGKLPQRMADLANTYKKPIVALCGKRDYNLNKLDNMFNGVFAIQTGPSSMETSIANTKRNLTLTSQNIIYLLSSVKKINKNLLKNTW